MDLFTMDQLLEMMRTSAGVDENVDLTGDVGDRAFQDLGYDSLAVLELASQVQRRYGLAIPDDAVKEMVTPALAVSYINSQLAQPPVG